MEFCAVKCSFLLRDCPPLHAMSPHSPAMMLLIFSVACEFSRCLLSFQSCCFLSPHSLFLKWYSMSRHEQLSQNKSQLFSVCEIALFTIQISSEKIKFKKCLIGLRRSPPSHGRRREKARKLEKTDLFLRRRTNWTKCSSVPQ